MGCGWSTSARRSRSVRSSSRRAGRRRRWSSSSRSRTTSPARGRGEPAVVLWPADLIEALIATDRREDAGAALDALAAQARRTGGAWARGVVARYRGVLADDADIDAAFGSAIACPRRGDAVRARAHAAVLRRATAPRGAADRRTRAAAAGARRLRRARGASCGPSGPGASWPAPGSASPAARSADRDRLTHQELQIAELRRARGDEQGGRGRPVPEPEDDRDASHPRLSQARRALAQRARARDARGELSRA